MHMQGGWTFTALFAVTVSIYTNQIIANSLMRGVQQANNWQTITSACFETDSDIKSVIIITPLTKKSHVGKCCVGLKMADHQDDS